MKSTQLEYSSNLATNNDMYHCSTKCCNGKTSTVWQEYLMSVAIDFLYS